MKPRVGVSACLLGQAVRYDGGSRPQPWIVEKLSRHAQLLPFCPETEAGLGVPRPPVRLVLLPDEKIHALGVMDEGLDVTRTLNTWSRQQQEFLQSLDALIFKSRSPSCGLGSVPLHDGRGRVLGEDFDGIFTGWVRRCFPEMLFCDEIWLAERHHQGLFLQMLKKNVPDMK